MSLEVLFGKILRDERKKKSISQEELSYLCDLDRTYISMLERGKRQPSLKTLFLLSEALNIKTSSLIIELEKKCEK